MYFVWRSYPPFSRLAPSSLCAWDHFWQFLESHVMCKANTLPAMYDHSGQFSFLMYSFVLAYKCRNVVGNDCASVQ